MGIDYPATSRTRLSETESDDHHRQAFARDRDRLIYASAFRRLAGKSQVVASQELGPFHNRLTHSLKVAQVGVRIAQQLAKTNNGQGPDVELVDFACLAHDIGHPPFGHAGEAALNRAVDEAVSTYQKTRRRALTDEQKHDAKIVDETERLAFGGFEGNPQSLRIVTRLSHKSMPSDFEAGPEAPAASRPTQWYGIDVTAAAIDALTKYPRTLADEASKVEGRKWGCYGTGGHSDKARLEIARGRSGAYPVLGPDATRCFEAQVMDWADDVTYAVHDMDDFYQTGFIPLHLLFGEPETKEWEDFRDYVHAKWTSWSRGTSVDDLDAARTRLSGGHPHPFILMPTEPFRNTDIDRRMAHARVSALLTRFTEGAHYEGEPYLHQGRFKRHSDADVDALLKIECNLLQELIWYYVIRSQRLASQQEGQRRIIHDLFEIVYESRDSLLPKYLMDMLETDTAVAVGYADETMARIRITADYIASLTEPHAIAMHRRLTGHDLGGITDLI